MAFNGLNWVVKRIIHTAEIVCVCFCAIDGLGETSKFTDCSHHIQQSAAVNLYRKSYK